MPDVVCNIIGTFPALEIPEHVESLIKNIDFDNCLQSIDIFFKKNESQQL